MDRDETQPFDAATTVEHLPEAKAGIRPLRIDADLLTEILDHLRSWLPNEGCGLLASIRESEGDRAAHFFPGTNIDHSPVRYTMDPVEVIEAMKRIRAEQWQLAAIVHSHPRTQPVPSRTDREEWFYPDARLMIVSFASADPEIGCWGMAGDEQAREIHAVGLLIEER